MPRTAARCAPALVLQDDEQVTVLDGGRGEGWTGGGGSVRGGGLGSGRAACRSLGAFGRCPGDLASVGYVLPLTLKDETLIWASLAIWFCGVCRVGVGGSREQGRGAACEGEGWLAAPCASPLPGERRRFPCPAVCVCTHRSDVCVGRGLHTAAWWDARGPRSLEIGSVSPLAARVGLVVLCNRARARPGYLERGSCDF